MAEVLDTSVPSLRRWQTRQHTASSEPSHVGRPTVIPDEAQDRIRQCYRDHYGQWGPQVLAAWCRGKALGEWSPSTIAPVIADLREEPEEKSDPL